MTRERGLLALGICLTALVSALFVVGQTEKVQPTEAELAALQGSYRGPLATWERREIPAEAPTAQSPNPRPSTELVVADVHPAPGGAAPDQAVGDRQQPVLALEPVGLWLLGEALTADGDRDALTAVEVLELPGTRDGIDALLAGNADAALLLGPLAVPELDAGLLAFPLTDHILVPVAHPRIPIGNINRDAFQQVATGRIHDWSWLGAEAGGIDLLAPADPAQRQLVERLLLDNQPFATGVGAMPLGDDGVNTLASRPGSLGLCSLAQIQANDRANTLKMNLRRATPQAYRAGAWRLGATLHLVTVGTPRGGAARIHSKLFAPEAGEALAARGFPHR